MNWITAICIAAPAMLLACASKLPSGADAIFNPDLAAAHADREVALTEERSPLSFEGEREANNCNSYFDLSSRYRMDESTQNHLIKSEYLICDALRFLSSPKAANKQPDPDQGTQLLSKLDLRSLPSSLRQRTSRNSHTLAALFPDLAVAGANTASVETDEFSFSIEVVASTRVNDNDEADWIVWMADEAKSGTYRDYRTFLILDPHSSTKLEAIAYP